MPSSSIATAPAHTDITPDSTATIKATAAPVDVGQGSAKAILSQTKAPSALLTALTENEEVTDKNDPTSAPTAADITATEDTTKEEATEVKGSTSPTHLLHCTTG